MLWDVIHSFLAEPGVWISLIVPCNASKYPKYASQLPFFRPDACQCPIRPNDAVIKPNPEQEDYLNPLLVLQTNELLNSLSAKCDEGPDS
jgi:hypothetical protein